MARKKSLRVSATINPDQADLLEDFRERVYYETGARLSVSAAVAIMVERGLQSGPSG